MPEDKEMTERGSPALPSELRDPPPRKVRIKSPDGQFGLIVGLLLVVVGGVAFGASCFSAYRQMQKRAVLLRGGRDIDGLVTGTHGGRGPATVSYTFVVSGVTFQGRAQMPDYRLILHASDRIVVRYLPSDPAINHPAAWEGSAGLDIVPRMFFLLFAIGGTVALIAVLRDRRLARVGNVAEGVVTNCARNKRQFRVEYRFSTDDASQVRGSCNSWEGHQAGDHIWIMYLPDRPRRNHSYPLAYVEIVDE